MAGELQPLSDNFSIVDENGKPTIYFIQWAQQRSIDISEATTPEQVTEILVAYIAANPVEWGDIDGTLSAQTDLQAALDLKLGFTDNFNGWGVGYKLIDAKDIIMGGAGHGFIDLYRGQVPNSTGGFYAANEDESIWYQIGKVSTDTYVTFRGSHPYQFLNHILVPDEAYGSGWNGSLTVPTKNALWDKIETLPTTGGVLPVVDGSIPPVFLQNPDGSLIYTPI